MMKSIPSLFAILISLLAIFTYTNAVIESNDESDGPRWLADSHRNRIHLFKKWLGNTPADAHASSSPADLLHSTRQFKGARVHRLFSL